VTLQTVEAIVTDSGAVLHGHVAALFPICRSITGNGLRETLRYVGEHLPLTMHEVPSGTPVLDWHVPPEWNVHGARLRTLSGRTVIDFADNALHLLNYSTPQDRVVTRAELQAHLHSLPDQPDLIPYRTSYYTLDWGFCLSERARQALDEDAYHVQIDTSLQPGSLTYGECVLPGELPDEVLISVHVCHPSLANDNLSSLAVAIELARALADRERRFSYRFVFAPGTIGAITWLHFNRVAAARIRHGLVLTCLGDPAPPSYKLSRRGDAAIDRYAGYVLQAEGHGERVQPFAPTGYDERQYGSPGFDLPVGCLMRSPGGTFRQYHTSADNLGFVTPDALADSLRVLTQLVHLIEQDRIWRNTAPFGEPQLGRRGLYGGAAADKMALLWTLNLSDGRHSLFDIAQRSRVPFTAIVTAAGVLAAAGLLVADAAGHRPVTADASAA
jgi:aminopeptidase-like protein